MPIYEYQCADCHHQFDLLQKINDEPTRKCPKCSKETVVRLVSAAGFQLKGTGWYATDFKDKGKAPKNAEHSTSAHSVSKAPESDAKGVEKKSTETTGAASTTTSSTTTKGESN